MKNYVVASSLLLASLSVFAATPAPSDARVYIISPANGELVSSPVKIQFGLTGMGVAPAGLEKAKTGHHHLIVDANTPNLKKAIPKDAKHIHFGGGQTETTIELSPGTHTLQLVLGDKAHIPHNNPVISDKITITVQ